ncbi:hypothetical protein D3C71_757310 [compost metagenome]
MGNEENGHAFLFLQQLDQFEDLRLDRYVKRRCRFIGNEQFRAASKRHRDHDALAHAAGHLVRIFFEAFGGGRNAHLVQQAARLFHRVRQRQAAMCNQHFGNLVADRQRRIEARHRLLKDHRDPVAANIAHFSLRQGCQLLALELHRSFDPAGLGRIKPHDRHRGNALAGTGFTHQGQRLARMNIEGHVAHDGKPDALAVERGFQARHGHHRCAHGRVLFL